MTNTRREFLKAAAVAGMASGAVLRGGFAARLARAGGEAATTNPGEQTMRTIVSEGFGRIVVLSFDRGEKLRESIRERLKYLGIKDAVLVSAMGTLEKARFHRIKHTGQLPEDEVFEIDAPIELAAVDGIVADGEPHFHMVFQDMDRAYAAHLEDGSVVCYLAEIVLAEIKGVQLTRLRNAHGVMLLQEKKP